jgi:hypothetical protein
MGKVAKKNETNVVEFDISMMEADASVGVSNMGQDDLALPFLKILSGLDPLLDELSLVPTNVGSFNGLHGAQELGHQ